MPTRREVRARKALSRLGPRRFEAVVRIAAASRLRVGEELAALIDRGESIEPLFFDGEEYGHVLEVRGRGRKVHVRLGFMAEPSYLAAQVGEWDMEFNADDTVASVDPMIVLIS